LEIIIMAKQINKAAAVTVTLSQAEQIKLATSAGEAARTMVNAKDAFNAAAKKLRDAKATIGKSVRTCKLAQAFLQARFGDKKPAGAANALSAFRAAVNEGKAYDENAKRKAKAAATKAANKAGGADVATDDEAAETEDKAAKGKTHVGTSETATTYACTIARKGSAAKASQSLRDLFNKMKGSEEYSDLCAYLLDGLDEYDGE
jgi:hypothetical protein